MSWLLAKSFGRVTAAMLLSVALVATSYASGSLLAKIVPTWRRVPDWAEKAAWWLGEHPPMGANYQAIVSAALGVSGSLAGVYFATVAFVVSTTYKDATPRVRALVTRLPGGRIYTAVYIQAVLFSLVILMLPMTGINPNRLQLAVVTLLGGFVVLSFGQLRTQLYGLIEPTALLSMIQGDLARAIKQASNLTNHDPTGFRTRNIRMQTSQSLHTLQDLCYLIRDRERSSTNVPAEYAGTDPRVTTAARAVHKIWIQYAQQKSRLTSLPGWSPSRASHKDWLLASDTEIGVALATSTTLPATATDDALWIERRLAATLGELLGGREAPQLASILDNIEDPVRWLVARGMFAESRLWIEAVVSPARTATIPLAPDKAANAENNSESRTEITETDPSEGHLYNLADHVGLAYTQAVLGLHDYAATIATDLPDWSIAQANGKNKRRLGPLPTKLLRDIRDGLEFESSVEGRRITSDANIRQLVARDIATESIDEAHELMSSFENIYWPWVRRVLDGEKTVAGGALSRLDEALHKWELPFSALQKLFDQCEALHRDIEDRWPDLSLDSLRARQRTLQDLLRVPIVQIAIQVDVDINSDRPDVFGWAFFRAHQDLLDDVLSVQAPIKKDMQQRLGLLIGATDRASNRLQSTVRRQHVTVLGSFRSEPLLMLLQLSGIALITGIIQNKPDLHKAFEQVWNKILDTNAQGILEISLAALAMDESLLGISPGKVSRTGRHLRAISKLESLAEAAGGGNWTPPRPHLRLSSKVNLMIRTAANGHWEDVFVAFWLIPATLKRGAKLPPDSLSRRLSSLQKASGRRRNTSRREDGR